MALLCVAMACGDDDGGTDAGRDTGTTDTGTTDTGTDTGAADTGTDTGGEDTGTDTGVEDGGADAATDAATDGGGSCDTDADCVSGEEWCVEGACVPCSNDGLLCDIACPFGWETYERNGCFPCECAPTNACDEDSDCPSSDGAAKCYAGAFCWDWCPDGDPSCCFGNLCSAPGCSEPPPSGCRTRGCAMGESCEMTGCVPSGCGCNGGSWLCTADCGGGTCVAPD